MAALLFPTKPLGGYGAGGAIFTNNDKIAKICKQIRLHGQIKKNKFIRLGINGRMDTIQCAVVLQKLKLFKQEIILRNNVAKNYIQMLKKTNIEDLEIIQKLKKNNNVWAQFTIKVKSFKRAKLIKHLKNLGYQLEYITQYQ